MTSLEGENLIDPRRDEARALLERALDRSQADATEAEELARKALEIAREIGDLKIEARARLRLAQIKVNAGHHREALDDLREVQSFAESVGSEPDALRAIHSQGIVFSTTGRLAEAALCYEQAMPRAEAIEDWTLLLHLLNSAAIIHIRMADYEGAQLRFDRALGLLRLHPDPALEASIRLNIGHIYQRSGDYETSGKFFNASLSHARAVEDRRLAISALVGLSTNALQTGDKVAATQTATEALEMAHLSKSRDLESHALKELGDVLTACGDFQTALGHYRRALSIAIEGENEIMKAALSESIGRLQFDLGNLSDALEWLSSALGFARRVDSPQVEVSIHLKLAELYETRHDYAQANKHLRRHLELRERLLSEENKRAITNIQVKNEVFVHQKQAELERVRNVDLKEANERLQKLADEMGDLLRIVSHDLRNPLGAIIGMANELYEEPAQESEEIAARAKLIEDSGRKMLKLVNEMLALHRKESTQSLASNLAKVVDEVFQLVGPVAQQKSIRLEHRIPKSLPPIAISEHQLHQTISNLVSNSLKFTGLGGQIRVNALHLDDGTVEITVADNGVGFAAEGHRFSDPKPGTLGETGSGMGLGIVHQIVYNLGGEVTFGSSNDRGAKVGIRLPVSGNQG